jgi:hypothetical protein
MISSVLFGGGIGVGGGHSGGSTDDDGDDSDDGNMANKILVSRISYVTQILTTSRRAMVFGWPWSWLWLRCG